LLVDAEFARVRSHTTEAMRSYEDAIETATHYGYTQECALASERAAHFYQDIGQNRIARMYLAEAHEGYLRGGASAQARHLEHANADQFDTSEPSLHHPAARRPSPNLPIVVQAAQIFASTLALDTLLERVMRLMLDHTGARQGAVLLERDGALFIEAEGTADDETLVVLQHAPLARCDHLATAVVTHVWQTGEPVVLDAAAHDPRFASDPFIAARGGRAILCMPILFQAGPGGVLYLEHASVPGGFTPDKVELVQMLLSHAASALENACRYDHMKRKIDERQRAEEALRSITEGTASVTGGDFFRSLVCYLADVFQVRYAMISECTDSTKTWVRTLAFLCDNAFNDNVEYSIEGTPCALVVGGEVSYFPEHLAELFPGGGMGMQSYLGAPLQNSTGDIVGHLAVMDDNPMQRTDYDISILKIFAARAGIEVERKQAEEALRGSESRYRDLYNKTPVMLHSVDHQGRLISVSDYWLQVFGYTRDEVLGRQSSDFLTDECREQARHTAIPQFFATGQAKDLEFDFVKKNGEVMNVLLSAIAERDEFGDITQALAVLVDVTERKRAEEALRQSEEQLRHLNEQLEDYSRNLERKVAERTQEIEQRRRVAEGLHDLLTVLNSSRSLDEILCYILDKASSLLGTESGAIYRLEDQHDEFSIQASRGLPAAYVDQLTFPVDQSFLGQAVLNRQPFIITDLKTAAWDEQIVLSEQRRELLGAYQALLAVPLIRQGETRDADEIYGGIALYYPSSKQFTDEQIDLAMAFADQAALAIENAHLRQRVKQAAVMEERGRLARELHDSVTQSLYSLTLLAEGWRRLAGSGRLDNFEEPLTELGSIGQQALKEMRLLVHELRPPALEKQGLLGALHERLAAVERRAGVDARLLADDMPDLPVPIEEDLYRIAQEALNNTLKHAAATVVTVHIRTNAHQVELEVIDNGQGFDAHPSGEQGGIGLNSMRERAEKRGGALLVTSAPGNGTSIKVTLKLNA
jgi:PAS domain S-box-containing protein